ncbi:hypothetical protein HDE68_000292 [Pedobacter cryoconitis]|uniref:Uncharacterized protein n=1 Tax=Pedobacter cryoconitis TaxID=188932 RepID=A0A7W8ZI18_9SPHI|nr:hypothetical protein [Pedobacter cryoconitis]
MPTLLISPANPLGEAIASALKGFDAELLTIA